MFRITARHTNGAYSVQRASDEPQARALVPGFRGPMPERGLIEHRAGGVLYIIERLA